MSLFWAAALKPIFLLLALGFLLAVRYAVIRYMPEGRLKRILLLEV